MSTVSPASASPAHPFRSAFLAILMLVAPLTSLAGAAEASHEAWQGSARWPNPAYGAVAAAVGGTVYVALGGSSNLLDAYDPATDTWASRAPLPVQLYHAGAGAWGDKLVVVGMLSWWCETGSCTVAYAYDPVTDGWFLLPPLPYDAMEPIVADVDGTLHVIGGWACGASCVARTEVLALEVETGSWIPRAPLPEGAFGGVAIPAPGGLYVGFASTDDWVSSRKLHLYDASRDTWETMPPAPADASRPAAGVCDGKIILAGGSGSTGSSTDAVQVFDPVARTWSLGPRLPTPMNPAHGFVSAAGSLVVVSHWGDVWRLLCAPSTLPPLPVGPQPARWVERATLPTGVYAAAAAMKGSQYYVMGGYDSLQEWAQVDDVWIHDGALDVWTAGPDLPYPVGAALAATVGETIFLVTEWGDLMALEPGAEVWTILGPIPRTRPTWEMGIAADGERLYLLGGFGPDYVTLIADSYHVASGTWEILPDLPPGTVGAAVTAAADGIYVAGGYDFSTFVESPRVFVLRDGAWEPAPDLPAGRARATGAMCAGLPYVVGGYTQGGETVRTETLVADGWIEGPDAPVQGMWTSRGAVGSDERIMLISTGPARSHARAFELRCAEPGPFDGIAPGSPDLVVADLAMTRGPEQGHVHDRAEATIRNAGDAPSLPTEVEFRAGEMTLGRSLVGPLQPGATARVESPDLRGADVLQANLTAVVDPDDRVDEASESNNARSTFTAGDGFLHTCDTPGPDAAGYTCAPVAAAWTELAALPSTPLEGCGVRIDLPFPFPYYGVSRSAAWISPHGFLAFDAQTSCAAARPQDAIVPLYDPTRTGRAVAWWGHTSVDLREAYVIEWFYEQAEGATFEAILFPDGDIQLQYSPYDATFGSDAFAGVVGPAGAAGLSLAEGHFAIERGFALRIEASDGPLRGPDLAIAAWTEPAEPREGEATTLHARITNHGSTASPATRASLSVDGKHATSILDVPPLAPDAAFELTGATWVAEVGAHAVVGIADADQRLVERSEVDNVAARPLVVAPVSLGEPDLVPRAIEMVPAAPRGGDLVTFAVDVENAGDAPTTEAAYLELRIDEGESYWRTVEIPPLPAGARVTLVFRWTWTAVAGPHDAEARADVAGFIQESDEENNAFVRTLQVASPAPSVNLRVANANVSNDWPEVAEETTLSVDVTNAGNAESGPFQATFSTSDGETYAVVDVESLAPGESRRVASPPWSARAGVTALRAVADEAGVVPESDESDNSASARIRVREPDLRVDDLGTTPTLAQSGDVIVLHANVTNVGDASALASKLRFAYDGKLVGEADLPPLAPGARASVSSLPTIAFTGVHRAEAVADPHAALAEADESNNRQERPVLVAPRTGLAADLMVLDVDPAPGTYSSNWQIEFRATVGNGGAVPATGFDVRFELDGISLGTARVEALAPGQTQVVTSAPWDAVPGDHALRVTVDARAEVAETDESNNVATHAAVPRSPDLVVDSLALDLADPRFGTNPAPLVGVRNLGNDTALASRLEVRLDGALRGTLNVPSLEPGARVELRGATFFPLPGDHVLEAKVDSGNANDEIVETNNDAAHSFHTALRGLQVDAITFDPPSPTPGQAARIQAHVRNDGLDPVGASQVRFEADGATLGDAEAPALAPGESAVVEWTGWTFPSGLHLVRATADITGAVAEYDEADNALLGSTQQRTNACSAAHDGVSYACYSVPYSWTSVSGGTPISLGDDSIAAISLPFSFPYYGASYATAYVSSNGFLSFDPANGAACCTARDIPSTTAPNGIVAAYWADLYPPDLLADVHHRTITLEGKQAFVVQWSDVPHYNGRTDRATFQIILFQDGTIRFVYNNARGNGETHVAGIENPSGTAGLRYFRGSGTLSSQAVEFVPNSLASLPQESVDLKAVALTYAPTDPQQDGPLTLDGSVSNAGPGVARGFRAHLRLDSVTRVDRLVAALAPGAQLPVRLDLAAPGGEHTIGLAVDPAGQIPETSEFNNARSGSFYARRPDLVVEDLWVEPDPIRHGDIATFHARVRNVGSGDALLATTTRFVVDGFMGPFDAATPPVPAGESVVVEASGWSARGGNRQVYATADARRVLSEWSEDNTRSEALRVLVADLIVESVAIDPASPVHGDELSAVVRVANVGDDAAAASVLRLSFDGAATDAAVPALAAGARHDVTIPLGAAVGGTHALVATADALAQVTEGAEWNNQRSLSARVRQADLVVAALRNSTAQAGEAMEITATVRNAGDADAPASILRFLLDGALLADAATPALVAGATADVTVAWSATGGEPRVEAVADALGAVAESDETNNVRTLSFHVNAAQLVAGPLSLDVGSPEHGQPVVASLVVANAGDAEAAASVVRLRLDGVDVGEAALAPLAPGAEALVGVPWTATGGDHVLSAHVDVTDAVPETDESDNEAALALHVRQADLAPGALVADPASPVHGQPVALRIEVENRGDAVAAPSRARFLVDGGLVALVDVPAVAPGARLVVEAPAWTALGGDRALAVVVDAEDAVPESDEAGNVAALALHVRQANLAAVSLAATPASPAEGEPVALRVALRNDGDADAEGFVVRVLAGAQVVQDVHVALLGPGASVDVEVGWTATGGDVALVARVDALGAVAESDESDNEQSVVLHVRQVDLVAGALALSDASPADGDALTATVTIRNAGDADAASFLVRVRLDGETLWETNVAALAAGASASLDVPLWLASPGSHVVRVEVDADDARRERNEANNAAEATYHARQPDLVAGEIATSQSLAPENKEVAIRAKVRNDGNASAGAFRVRFVLQDGTQVGDVEVAGLAAGAVVEVSAPPAKLKLGMHTVTVRVDWLGAVREPSEANNEASKTFAVTSPGAL